VNKATGIKAVFILLLLILVAGYFYLPGVIYKQLAASANKFDSQLQCLDWQIKSFEQVQIERLCLHYQGTTLELRDAQLLVSPVALISGSAAADVLQKAKIKQLYLQIPVEKLQTKSESDSDNAQSFIPPWLPLPDIEIDNFHLQLLAQDGKPIKSQSALLSWQISAKSDFPENHVHLTNIVDEQNWLQLKQHESGTILFNWQMSLAELLALANELPVPELSNNLAQIKSLSGIWQGNFRFDSVTPDNWSVSNGIQHFSTKVEVPGNSDKPLTLQGDIHFNLEKDSQQFRLSKISGQPLLIGGLAKWSAEHLDSVSWQEWKLQNPLSEELQLTLPEEIHLIGLTGLSFTQPLLIRDGDLEIQLQQMQAALPEKTISGQINIDGEFTLFKQEQQVGLNLSSSGKLSYTPEAQQLNLSQWQLSSETWQPLIADILPIVAGNLMLTGHSDIRLRGEQWSIIGGYQSLLDGINANISDAYSLKIEQIRLNGEYQLQPDSLVSASKLHINNNLPSTIRTEGSFQQLNLSYELTQSALNPWLKLVKGLPKNLQVANGEVAATVNAYLLSGELSPLNFKLELEELTATYNNYLLSNARTQFEGSLTQDGKLVSEKQNLQIERLFAGVNLDDIQLSYRFSSDPVSPKADNHGFTFNPVIEDFSATLLGGTVGFNIPLYVLAPESRIELSVQKVSVPEVVKLLDQQGLLVTGELSGVVPVVFSEGSVSVRQAKLNSVGSGVIKIKDNPAFISLKNSQKNLATALGLLENLEYSQLNTNLSLQPDGWLELAVNIKGVNPEQQQPINFNPTFSTNLYTGLKALRAGKDISKAIEQRF